MIRVTGASAILVLLAMSAAVVAQSRPKQLIAHRGASGYAPEHTQAAYQLALDQHADFVEPDLAITKDGRLICLHDDTLERTTNIEDLFPDRATTEPIGRGDAKHWIANDFTLAEIKRLDAGSWFGEKYAGAKILTFEEMVALVRGKAGIYPELKSPPLYIRRGVDMEKIFVESIKKQGLDQAESLKATPVIIQSFDWDTVARVAKDLPTIPRVYLTSDDGDVSGLKMKELAGFATGIAPEKSVIARNPEMVARAHALGLTVTAWTFRAGEKTSYPSVRDEMAHFLYTLNIDALFTNNPDQFPRR